MYSNRQCYLISILNYSMVNGVDRRVDVDRDCLDKVGIYILDLYICSPLSNQYNNVYKAVTPVFVV